MAAVFWLCEGSIINCLIIEDLFEWFDEVSFYIRCIVEISGVSAESTYS